MKITAAQARVAELVTLTAELQEARASLQRHRPDGPCDDTCGCTAMPSPVRGAGVTLLPASSTGSMACTLDAGSMGTRLQEWQALMGTTADAVGSEPMTTAIDGGVRLEFPRGVDVTQLARLAEAEQGCCRFFSFTITVDERGIGLEVRSPDEDLHVVHAAFGGPG